MRYCQNCGQQVEENSTFCQNCGHALNQPVQPSVNVTTLAKTEYSSADKHATSGFVLGLVSIIAWLLPLFGYPVTICGIVYSVKGLKSNSKKVMAIIGLVLSIIFLFITLINSLLGALLQIGAMQ